MHLRFRVLLLRDAPHYPHFLLLRHSVVPSLLAEEAGGDVAHVCLLHLVVVAAVAVDTHILECFHDSVEVEAHIDEAVDEVLVPALVSRNPGGATLV